MKKLFTIAASITFFSLYSHSELNTAIDNFDYDTVVQIIQDDPTVLSDTEAIKVVERLNRNQKGLIFSHFFAGIATSCILGIMAGVSARMSIFTQDMPDNNAASAFVGSLVALGGIIYTGFTFDDSSYRMLLSVLSKPLNKEQLKILGVLPKHNTVVVHR